MLPSCRVSGDNPTHADSYDIDVEVPASTADQATATLLQNLNISREAEQVSTASQLLCKQRVRVRLDLCIDAEDWTGGTEGCQVLCNAKLSDCRAFTFWQHVCLS